jgi:cell division protein FtsL
MAADIKSKIESNKIKSIMNKNNFMYGYTSLEEAQKIHNTLREEMDILEKAYINKLYTFLYYTENAQLTNDMNQLNSYISDKIADIKQYTMQGNYKEVVEAYRHIKDTYKCIHKLKQYIQSIYTEQLIHCNQSDAHIDPKTLIEPPAMVSTIPLKKTKRTVKEKSTETKKTGTKKKTSDRKPDQIDNIISSAKDLLKDDRIFNLAKTDPDAVSDLETYMDILSKNISSGSIVQRTEYDQLVAQYNKFKNSQQSASSISKQPDRIDNLILSVKDLLTDDRIYDIAKDDPEVVSDLDTYMELLASGISKASTSQKTEYDQLLAQYNKFKTHKQSSVPSGQPQTNQIEQLLGSAREMLQEDISKDDTEAVSDLETYMELLNTQISKGSSSQKSEYDKLVVQYDKFKNSSPPDSDSTLNAVEL